jgi:DNA ligase 1
MQENADRPGLRPDSFAGRDGGWWCTTCYSGMNQAYRGAAISGSVWSVLDSLKVSMRSGRVAGIANSARQITSTVHVVENFIMGEHMTFKPMLASHCKDTSKLKFPVLASKKLDGVRATVQGGVLLSRSLKQIPNVHVQSMFKGLPEGLDGELIFGNPCSPSAYRDTVSIVMSDDKPADGIKLHVFDKFIAENFGVRVVEACVAVTNAQDDNYDNIVFVEHTYIKSIEELDEFEAAALAEGNEGVMIRSLEGPYKQGRSSEKEAYLLKLKRFADMEAIVTGMEELLTNNNPAFRNELGRTARSSAKAGKVGDCRMGKLLVRGLNGPYEGVDFQVGTGFDDAQRDAFWLNPPIGQVAKIKFFPTGGKDLPRHPVFLGWRDQRDM